MASRHEDFARIRMKKELHKKLKEMAKRDQITMTALIATALEDYELFRSRRK